MGRRRRNITYVLLNEANFFTGFTAGINSPGGAISLRERFIVGSSSFRERSRTKTANASQRVQCCFTRDVHTGGVGRDGVGARNLVDCRCFPGFAMFRVELDGAADWSPRHDSGSIATALPRLDEHASLGIRLAQLKTLPWERQRWHAGKQSARPRQFCGPQARGQPAPPLPRLL